MNFTDFMVKWNGQPVDFDGVYPNQCMDLAHQYVYDVLGITDKAVIAHPSACQVYDNFTEDKYFDKIANTPTGVPLEGDIVVFKCNSALPNGHVCIFIEGDANKFKSFDCNWPTGSLPHVQDHTYGYCAGWLHPKAIQPDLTAELNQTRLDRDRNWNWFIEVCSALGVGSDVNAAVNEAKKLVSDEDVLIQTSKQLKDAQTKINDLGTQLSALTTVNDTLKATNATLTQKVADQQVKIDEQDKSIENLGVQIENLKASATIPTYTGLKKLLIDFIAKL